jgi:hypothetical protein
VLNHCTKGAIDYFCRRYGRICGLLEVKAQGEGGLITRIDSEGELLTLYLFDMSSSTRGSTINVSLLGQGLVSHSFRLVRVVERREIISGCFAC